MSMKRRIFFKAVLQAGAASTLSAAAADEIEAIQATTWKAASKTLACNVRQLPDFDRLVLFEGSTYHGIWLECGPHESLSYAELSRFVTPVQGKPSPIEVATNTHGAFFALQREDGQLPASVKLSGRSWGQIQMVVPIALDP
jgi:hypothetical protein